jgi:hypothetical protein
MAMTPPTPKSAYAAAGVDIDAQEKGLARVKQLAKFIGLFLYSLQAG